MNAEFKEVFDLSRIHICKLKYFYVCMCLSMLFIHLYFILCIIVMVYLLKVVIMNVVYSCTTQIKFAGLVI